MRGAKLSYFEIAPVRVGAVFCESFVEEGEVPGAQTQTRLVKVKCWIRKD
jgi:hypothetical protein